MRKLKELIDCIEEIAPPAFQEEYDNSGLILGTGKDIIQAALVALDVTEKVVKEAIEKNCQLVISHHPLIFKPLKKILNKSDQERALRLLIQNDIALYAAHTSLDNAPNGINMKLAEKLGLSNVRILNPLQGFLKKLIAFCPESHIEQVKSALFFAGAGNIGNYDCCSFSQQGMGSFRANNKANPFVGKKNQIHHEAEIRIEVIFPSNLQSAIIQSLLKSHPYEEVAYDIIPLDNEMPTAGSGVIGELAAKLAIKDFLNLAKKVFKNPHLKYCKSSGRTISKVAICSGSGSFLMNNALQEKADAFITADLKYHDFQTVENRILAVDVGHYESESIAKVILKDGLCQKFPNFAVHISKTDDNPINYT